MYIQYIFFFVCVFLCVLEENRSNYQLAMLTFGAGPGRGAHPQGLEASKSGSP